MTAPTQRRTFHDAQADRRVSNLHQIAQKYDDPVAFMRGAQRAAERDYARHGGKARLAMVRALERSLDGAS